MNSSQANSSSSSSSTKVATQRVLQACDACKLRKVKCNGQQKCQQCTHLDLQCIYTATKQARRPPQRGRIIAQYRESTHRSTSSPSTTLAPARPSMQRSTSSMLSSHSSPLSSDSPPQALDYPPEFFLELIPLFNAASFPFHPVVMEQEIRDCIANMYNSPDDCSFVYIFGGLVMNSERGQDAVHHVGTLIQRAIEIRPPPSPENSCISIRRAIASIWIQNCMHTLFKFDLAFMYLREATALLEVLRVNDPIAMGQLPLRERARRQRVYWEVFIHERYLGIMNYCPVIMTPLYTLPEFDDSLPQGVNEGFCQISKLFTFIDNDFIENWQNLRAGTSVTAAWFETKHRQLDEELADDNSVDMAMLSDMQQADLIVTRQWLRTLVWQMAMSKCLLSSRATKDCMSLLFPIKLSHQLRELIGRISRDAIRVNGYGILQKMFEVTDAIADVVIHVPAASSEESTVRIDHLVYLYKFLVTFPRFVPTQKRILKEKMETIQNLYPSIRTTYADLPRATMSPPERPPPLSSFS